MNEPRTGCYVYTCNGTIVARETWSVSTLDGGAVLIDSIRDASQFGACFRVKSYIANQRDSHHIFEFRQHLDGPVLQSTRYDCVGDNIMFDGQTLTRAAQDRFILFPLMRIFTGDTIRATQKRGGRATWVVPNIATPTQLSTLFEPEFSQRRVTLMPDSDSCFSLEGGPYIEPARLQFRPDGLLDTYQFRPIGSDQTWHCRYEPSLT